MKSALLIIILTSIVLMLFLFIPIVRTFPLSSFFTIDPDAVYFSNIITFVKTGDLYYFDHPGTPAIMIQGISLLPLAIFTKFAGYGFLKYVLVNVESVEFYLRVVNGITLSLGTGLVMHGIYNITKKLFLSVLSFILLLTFLPYYYSGVSISAESTNVLLTSLWILFLGIYLKTRKMPILVFLAAVSGIALGNRLTSITLGATTMVLLLVSNLNIRSKFKSLIVAIGVLSMSFVLSIYPVLDKAKDIGSWVVTPASRSGVHGTGDAEFISASSYIKYVSTLFVRQDHTSLLVLVGICLFFLAYQFISKNKKFIDINLIAVIAVSSFAVVGFSKYPLTHYQTTNFILLSFVVCLLLSKVNYLLSFICLIIMIPYVINTANTYSYGVTSMINNTAMLTKYAKENASAYPHVWDWARTKEFGIIWINDYTNIFSSDMTTYYPNLYTLRSDLETIKTSDGEANLFSICWDKMYLQKVQLEKFIGKHDASKFNIFNINGVDTHLLIKSDHCTTVTKP